MKTRLGMVLSLLLLFALGANPLAATQTPQPRPAAGAKVQDTVYLTKTGKKYHRAGCQYLRQSSIPVERSKAIAMGMTPCSKCRP